MTARNKDNKAINLRDRQDCYVHKNVKQNSNKNIQEAPVTNRGVSKKLICLSVVELCFDDYPNTVSRYRDTSKDLWICSFCVVFKPKHYTVGLG